MQNLRSSRAIDVDDRGAGLLEVLSSLEGYGHIAGGQLSTSSALKALVRVLGQADRGEGHEFRATQAAIQPLVHSGLGGAVHDGSVAQRTQPILHAPAVASHHLAVEQGSDRRGLDVARTLRFEAGFAERLLDVAVAVTRPQVDAFELGVAGQALLGKPGNACAHGAALVGHCRVNEDAVHLG